MTHRILSIDPSGTGTTGIYYRNGDRELFHQYQDKDWQKHYDFVLTVARGYKPHILLFETTNFIHLRGKDMTSLFKLLGALEILFFPCPTIQETKTIPVDQVKRLRTKLFKGEQQIPELKYQKGRGKGWSFKNKNISVHGLDAYLVYWLWQSKEIDKEILSQGSLAYEPSKNKQKSKQNDYQKETDWPEEEPEDEMVGGFWPPGGGSGCILMECRKCKMEYPWSMGHECPQWEDNEEND
jgi:hypothetical protein